MPGSDTFVDVGVYDATVAPVEAGALLLHTAGFSMLLHKEVVDKIVAAAATQLLEGRV